MTSPALSLLVRPEVPAHVAAYNANLRHQAGRKYFVIEVATGRICGDGTPFAHGYAEYVMKTLDVFNRGDYVMQEVVVETYNPSKHLAEFFAR